MKQRDRKLGVLKRMRKVNRRFFRFTWVEKYSKEYSDGMTRLMKEWVELAFGKPPTHDMRKHPRVVDYTLQPKCIQQVRRNRHVRVFPENKPVIGIYNPRPMNKKQIAGRLRRTKRREAKHPRFKHLPEGIKTPLFFAASV